MYVYPISFYLCHRKDLELHLSSSQFFPPDINERIETKSDHPSLNTTIAITAALSTLVVKSRQIENRANTSSRLKMEIGQILIS